MKNSKSMMLQRRIINKNNSNLKAGFSDGIKKPMIFHTYDPEVVHTDPANFKKVVQKLTGLNRSSNAIPCIKTKIKPNRSPSKPKQRQVTSKDMDQSSIFFTTISHLIQLESSCSTATRELNFHPLHGIIEDGYIFDSITSPKRIKCDSSNNSPFKRNKSVDQVNYTALEDNSTNYADHDQLSILPSLNHQINQQLISEASNNSVLLHTNLSPLVDINDIIITSKPYQNPSPSSSPSSPSTSSSCALSSEHELIYAASSHDCLIRPFRGNEQLHYMYDLSCSSDGTGNASDDQSTSISMAEFDHSVFLSEVNDDINEVDDC